MFLLNCCIPFLLISRICELPGLAQIVLTINCQYKFGISRIFGSHSWKDCPYFPTVVVDKWTPVELFFFLVVSHATYKLTATETWMGLGELFSTIHKTDRKLWRLLKIKESFTLERLWLGLFHWEDCGGKQNSLQSVVTSKFHLDKNCVRETVLKACIMH